MTSRRRYHLFTALSHHTWRLIAAWLVRNPGRVYNAYNRETDEAHGLQAAWAVAEDPLDLASCDRDPAAIGVLLEQVSAANRDTVRDILAGGGHLIRASSSLMRSGRGREPRPGPKNSS